MARIRFWAPAAALVALLAASPMAAAQTADPVIAAAGDIACDPAGTGFNGGAGTSTTCRQRYTSDLLVGQGLAAVLGLGDMQYEEGTFDQFQRSYDPSWGRVKSITRPAIGNHEYRLSPGTGYFDYFNGVGNATGPAGDRGRGYYSFNVGGWHMIALNSMCDQVPGGCGAGSAQEQWLRADLAANAAAPCTLAYWHHPLFNSGPDGDYKDTPWNTTALWQALYEGGAELVLSGHAHIYQRFGPQNANGNADPAYGIREFVVGTGGKSLGDFGPTQPNLEFRQNTQFGVIQLVLHANSYNWSFVNDAGQVVDFGSAGCHGINDVTPPQTTITSGPTGNVKTTTVSFAFVSSEANSTFQCKLDSGAFASCSSPKSYSGLVAGSHTFQVRATDAAGNTDATPATRTFKVTAPKRNSSGLGPART